MRAIKCIFWSYLGSPENRGEKNKHRKGFAGIRRWSVQKAGGPSKDTINNLRRTFSSAQHSAAPVPCLFSDSSSGRAPDGRSSWSEQACGQKHQQGPSTLPPPTPCQQRWQLCAQLLAEVSYVCKHTRTCGASSLVYADCLDFSVKKTTFLTRHERQGPHLVCLCGL